MIQPSSFHSAASVERRQRLAFQLMARLADRQRLPVDGKARARGRRFHHLDGLGHDFETDVVAEQNSDLQSRRLPGRRCQVGFGRKTTRGRCALPHFARPEASAAMAPDTTAVRVRPPPGAMSQRNKRPNQRQKLPLTGTLRLNGRRPVRQCITAMRAGRTAQQQVSTPASRPVKSNARGATTLGGTTCSRAIGLSDYFRPHCWPHQLRPFRLLPHRPASTRRA